MEKLQTNNLEKKRKANRSTPKQVYPTLYPPAVQLTRREAECFYLFSQVVTVKKVARSLGLSVRTVEMYVERLKVKMGVSYKSDLIEKAIALRFTLTC